MDYRIVQKDAFKVIGKKITVSTVNRENHRMITNFWEECDSDGTSERLCSLGNNDTMIGVCMDFENDKGQFAYMIAVEDKNNTDIDDLESRVIPAATWAIFTAVGSRPQAIIDLWSRIFQEWFPATGYQHADAPELEVFLPGDFSSEEYKCEVWIPIVKN